ncbi:acetyltransferase [Chlorobium sp. KB01]|uniref:acetyltransferase n=1 Tax=Chlorobium sp. KB01 TaxID=1917528 RepID=UPI0009777960|nr:acetyltransferase [Chlorobium sp. KB01]
MNKPYIILVGAGGHARSCIDVIEQQGQYQIAGLVGMPHEMHDKHLGYRVIATDDDLPQLVKEYDYALVSLGQILSPDSRIRLYQQARNLGFQFPVIIAPTAYISRHATLGSGTIVMHGAIVNAGVRVGDNCIINNRSLLEHDSIVADHCHISTGTILNGGVIIGKRSFIGSGTVIKEGMNIGQDCVIGMGLSVRYNQLDHARFTGKSIS